MHTISKLAKKSNLSRSTLLYYDRIGLLSPSGRTESNYRQYTEKDMARLQKICMFRQAGVPLKQIKVILDGQKSSTIGILEARLQGLNAEINRLRQQQQVVLNLLNTPELKRKTRVLDKTTWVQILHATGLSDKDMDQWHREFETQAPESHQDFLESLGLSKTEIKHIRKWSSQT